MNVNLSKMLEYKGEDLLKVFETLEINMGNLNPNVIKAWFDTDCQYMKNLLNWMCSSLTKANFISSQEIAELVQINNVVKGEKLDKEISNLDAKYPGVFELEINTADIQQLEDELEFVEQKQSHIDKCLIINENLSASLSAELSNLSSEQTKLSLATIKAQENCQSLAQELDEVNFVLHEQLIKCSNDLFNYEFTPVPEFVGNIVLKHFDENYNNIENYINKFVKEKSEKTIISFEEELEVSSNNDLLTVYNRLSYSRRIYLKYNVKLAELNAVQNYLDRYDINSILSTTRKVNSHMKLTSDLKHEEKYLILNKLKNNSAKVTDFYLNQPKLKLAENQLKRFESNLQYLNSVAEGIVKIIIHYLLINKLCLNEIGDVKKYEKYFKNIVSYVNKNLQNCQLRSDVMSEMIEEYNLNNTKSIEDQFLLINDYTKLLSNKNNCSLNETLIQISNLKSHIARLEKQLFITSVEDHLNFSNKFKKNIETLQKFLICGPTNRTVIISQELQLLLNATSTSLDQQSLTLKSAMQFSIEALKRNSSDKWLREYRQLWMNFINNPEKMLSVIEQIETLFNKKQAGCFSVNSRR